MISARRQIRLALRTLRVMSLALGIAAMPLNAHGEPAVLAQGAALRKAVAILKGSPYGNTDSQVRKHVVGSALIFPGSQAKNLCTDIRRPVWVFDVAVPANFASSHPDPIEGKLVLDAATGKMECAGLPFLD